MYSDEELFNASKILREKEEFKKRIKLCSIEINKHNTLRRLLKIKIDSLFKLLNNVNLYNKKIIEKFIKFTLLDIDKYSIKLKLCNEYAIEHINDFMTTFYRLYMYYNYVYDNNIFKNNIYKLLDQSYSVINILSDVLKMD